MKELMQINFKNQSEVKLQVVVKKTNDTFIKIPEFQEATMPLYLEVEHQQINTLLELTKVYPYVLLYFDEKDGEILFKGAAFSLNNFDKPFVISTQYKKILVLHYPIAFKLDEVSHIKLIS